MVMKRPGMPNQIPLTEVLFEMRRVGKVLRVTAIDARTGIEVIMVADPRQSQYTIKTLAARKLAYVLDKKRRQAEPPRGMN